MKITCSHTWVCRGKRMCRPQQVSNTSRCWGKNNLSRSSCCMRRCSKWHEGIQSGPFYLCQASAEPHCYDCNTAVNTGFTAYFIWLKRLLFVEIWKVIMLNAEHKWGPQGGKHALLTRKWATLADAALLKPPAVKIVPVSQSLRVDLPQAFGAWAKAATKRKAKWMVRGTAMCGGELVRPRTPSVPKQTRWKCSECSLHHNLWPCLQCQQQSTVLLPVEQHEQSCLPGSPKRPTTEILCEGG